jgi:energy-coupling factor transport system substrate-specific component
VSWQLGALAILALGLGGGFAWYERTRPDARTLALVATLAALGVLGRIAFAALPNVKPTTDVVLISGYALGGAPGFVVGAVSAAASNFFFGQGPWTPWQMAGWGLTGLLGAALRPLWRRRPGRLSLALVCAVVGYAFTALQDFGDWVTYSDHSLSQLAAYVGQGTGFDVISAAGCAAFALAFGPLLAGSLRRAVRRLHVEWRGPDGGVMILLVAAVGIALALAPALVRPHVARAGGAGIVAPVRYLEAAQNPDGGLGAAPGQPSSQLFSGWAALGLAAAGVNPAQVRRDGHSLLGYIAAGAAGAHDPGSIERTILVAAAAGANPRDLRGRDLLAALMRRMRPDGSVAEQVNLTAFAVLALRAAHAAVPAATVTWLLRQQDGDGGFNFAAGGARATSDPDDTGAALEALAGVAGPGAARVRARAIAYLRRMQNRDGGFPASPGAASNAQSTAFATQGLIAAGVGLAGFHRPGGANPLAYLRSLIRSDGAIAYARGTVQTPVWVTGEALMALAGKPLPLAASAPRSTLTAGGVSGASTQRQRTTSPRQRPSAGARRVGAQHANGRRLARAQPGLRAQRGAQRLAVARKLLSALGASAGFWTAVALAPVGDP